MPIVVYLETTRGPSLYIRAIIEVGIGVNFSRGVLGETRKYVDRDNFEGKMARLILFLGYVSLER